MVKNLNDQNFDTILNRTFKYAKQTAKEFYFQEWVPNPPKCPAFDGEIVHITREGWGHIIDETTRTKTDVLGRLFVLERAKALLEKSTTFSEQHQRNKKDYWVFDSVIEVIASLFYKPIILSNKQNFLVANVIPAKAGIYHIDSASSMPS